ncbi:MAG: hypothetical protein AB1442_02220 [Nitrospirota bacterium]
MIIRKAFIVFLLLLISVTACSKLSDKYEEYKNKKEVEKIGKERKAALLDKIKRGEKLDSFEISSLSSILSLEGKFNEGIDLLEKLQRSESYKAEQYSIYFDLALLYTEQYIQSRKVETKQQLLLKASKYLTDGFENTPEKALAYYRRAKVYSVMGCIEKAKADLREALTIAKSKNIIFFGTGIYLDKDHFVKIITNDLGGLEGINDNCILGHVKGG